MRTQLTLTISIAALGLLLLGLAGVGQTTAGPGEDYRFTPTARQDRSGDYDNEDDPSFRIAAGRRDGDYDNEDDPSFRIAAGRRDGDYDNEDDPSFRIA